MHVVADHEISQQAVDGNLGLLDDVGAEGDPADSLSPFDHRGNGRLGLGYGTKTGSVFTGWSTKM